MSTELYDDRYYAEMRAGGDGGFYERIVDVAGLDFAGRTVLDVGCGRGEMIRLAVRRGAARVVGVDASAVALEIAGRNLDAWGVDPHSYELICAGVENLETHVRDRFDRVLMIDFVEHVPPAVLADALRTVRRLLTPDGRLLVHTFPNRHLHNALCWLLGMIRPRQRERIERIHVNVQTAASLAAALRASGYDDCRVQVENDLIFASSFYQGMAGGALKRLARLLMYDLFQVRPVDRLVRLTRLDRLVYMSIYGVARA